MHSLLRLHFHNLLVIRCVTIFLAITLIWAPLSSWISTFVFYFLTLAKSHDLKTLTLSESVKLVLSAAIFYVLLCRQEGKRVNLKTGVTRKQSEHFLPSDTHACVFRKIWRALFSCNTVLRFALLSCCQRPFVEDGKCSLCRLGDILFFKSSYIMVMLSLGCLIKQVRSSCATCGLVWS